MITAKNVKATSLNDTVSHPSLFFFLLAAALMRSIFHLPVSSFVFFCVMYPRKTPASVAIHGPDAENPTSGNSGDSGLSPLH